MQAISTGVFKKLYNNVTTFHVRLKQKVAVTGFSHWMATTPHDSSEHLLSFCGILRPNIRLNHCSRFYIKQFNVLCN